MALSINVMHFEDHEKAVREAIFGVTRDYNLKHELLKEGEIISYHSNGDWFLAREGELTVKVGEKEEDIIIPENKTAAIFISSGNKYLLEAKSQIHLTCLLQKAA